MDTHVSIEAHSWLPPESGRLSLGCLCSSRCPFDSVGGIILHVRQGVAVEVKRDADTRMSEPFAHDLRRRPLEQQKRCMRVPQIVNKGPSQAALQNKQIVAACHVARIDRRSLRCADYQIVVSPFRSETFCARP